MKTAPYDPDAELCEDMGCPFFVKQEGCKGEGDCPRIEEHRKMRGAIYMIVGKGERFMGFLPRLKRH